LIIIHFFSFLLSSFKNFHFFSFCNAIIPELEVATWWTSLSLPENEIIELYREHGTCEQFHNEIKTDMDLERLPPVKFETDFTISDGHLLTYPPINGESEVNLGLGQPFGQGLVTNTIKIFHLII
jgi:hypothetical protein